MAGPGSITATMLLAGRANGQYDRLTGLMAVVASTMALAYLTFLLAEGIARILASTGNIVLTRMLGVVLAALAVQFVVDGVKSVAG